MKITCSGALIRWTATGTASSRTSYPKLKIFRESSGLYHFINEVELGTCGGVVVERNSQGLYECDLHQENRILVQENDVIGLYLPPLSQSGFNIFFTTYTTDQVNYVYLEDVTSSVSLSSGAMTTNTPQINIRIDTSVIIVPDPVTTTVSIPITAPFTPGDVPFANVSTVGDLSQSITTLTSLVVSRATVLFNGTSSAAAAQGTYSNCLILAIEYTVESLYCGHPWDSVKCTS